jgi:hypothetical protein
VDNIIPTSRLIFTNIKQWDSIKFVDNFVRSNLINIISDLMKNFGEKVSLTVERNGMIGRATRRRYKMRFYII